MLNIMLVDDETIARKDMRAMLAKFSNEFRIVAEAGDGDDALSKFQQFRPEIVITDIKMPRMDGIKLAQQILSISKETKIVLLSAYGEFQLAQQAIRLGVSTYLLKHELDPPLLLQTLTELAKQIHSETASTKETGLKKLLQQNSLEKDERESILKKFEGTMRSGSLYLTHLQLDHEGPPQQESFKIFRDISNKYIQETLPAEFIQIANNFLMIINMQQIRSTLDQASTLTQIIKHIQSEFKSHTSMSISASVAGPVSHIEKLSDLYRKTLSLLDYRIFTIGEAFLSENSAITTPAEADYGGQRDRLAQFKKELDQGDIATAKSLLKSLLVDNTIESRNIALLQFTVDELLLILRDMLFYKKLDTRTFDIYKQNKAIKEMKSIFQIYEWFANELDMLFPNETRYSIKLMKALQYIHAHYQEEISLEEMAAVMDVSMIYASQLFKKEVGEGFSAYLSGYRINKAIELLQSGNYKIYEISEMVGYQSTAYFCRAFKRHTGMNPTEYEHGRKQK